MFRTINLYGAETCFRVFMTLTFGENEAGAECFKKVTLHNCIYEKNEPLLNVQNYQLIWGGLCFQASLTLTFFEKMRQKPNF